MKTLIVNSVRLMTTGAFAGGASVIIVVYLLDLIGSFSSGSFALRPFWDNWMAGWVPSIWEVGGPYGLITGCSIGLLQRFESKAWPVWKYCLVGYLVAVPYIFVKVGPFNYGGELHNFSLTSIGIIFGLTYAVMDKFMWPALTWVATERVVARA